MNIRSLIQKQSTVCAGILLMLASGSALAHPDHGIGSGFLPGIAHPFSGLDHLLAMLAIGLWAGQGRDAAARMMPIAALASMAAGGIAAAAGLSVPMLEPMLASSVLFAGLLVLAGFRQHVAAPVFAGVFACLHGMAHVAEMTGGSLSGYAGGILLASAVLMGAGFVLSRCTPRARIAAAPISLAGAWMLLQSVA